MRVRSCTKHEAGSRLIDIDATHPRLADPRGIWKLIERLVADEGRIHAVHVVEELLQDRVEPNDDLRRLRHELQNKASYHRGSVPW